jgi:hypothetical protein
MRLSMHLQLLQIRADHFLSAIGALFRARKTMISCVQFYPTSHHLV